MKQSRGATETYVSKGRDRNCPVAVLSSEAHLADAYERWPSYDLEGGTVVGGRVLKKSSWC